VTFQVPDSVKVSSVIWSANIIGQPATWTLP
jgi:hypothetical protein